jgi:hypothetical protein
MLSDCGERLFLSFKHVFFLKHNTVSTSQAKLAGDFFTNKQPAGNMFGAFSLIELFSLEEIEMVRKMENGIMEWK